MIITIANEGAGLEKSLLAVNLAAQCALTGRKILLLDAGSHRQSAAWSSARHAAGIKPDIPARITIAKNEDTRPPVLSGIFRAIHCAVHC